MEYWNTDDLVKSMKRRISVIPAKALILPLFGHFQR